MCDIVKLSILETCIVHLPLSLPFLRYTRSVPTAVLLMLGTLLVAFILATNCCM